MNSELKLKFIELLSKVTNYDNVSFPKMTIGSELESAVIFYPKKNKDGESAKVSQHLIELFSAHSERPTDKGKLMIDYEIHSGDNGIEIKVKLININ